jgi:hypothetical protein
VLPEFLPFLMMSDSFMTRAVEISVGSLSPTINWTTLKLEEFDLPPLDQQCRIAEMLWAMDGEEQHMAQFAADAQQLLTAEVEEELDKLFQGQNDSLSNLLIGSPESGNSAPPSPTETGHFVLSLAALSRDGYVRGHLKPVPVTKAMLSCRVSPGDCLISRSNTQEFVGFIGIFDEDREDVSFPDTMMRLPVNEARVSKRFVEVVLQSRRGRLHMMSSAAGTSGSMKKINRRTLGTCLVPTPALDVQERVLSKFHLIREAANSVRSAQRSANAMKRAFIESFFGNLR